MRTPRLPLAAALLVGLAAAGPLAALAPSAASAAPGDGKDGKKGKGGAGGEPKKDPPKEGTKGDDPGKKDDGKPLSVGDVVETLTLDLLGGGSWTVAAARGKVVVLVFAAEFSAESLDALKALGDEKGSTAKSGASRVGVLRDADAAKARKLVKEHSLTVDLALDPRRKAYDRLAKAGLPYTVVLDRKGKIALSTSGFDDAAVARKVEELKKAKEPEKAKEPGKKK